MTIKLVPPAELKYIGTSGRGHLLAMMATAGQKARTREKFVMPVTAYPFNYLVLARRSGADVVVTALLQPTYIGLALSAASSRFAVFDRNFVRKTRPDGMTNLTSQNQAAAAYATGFTPEFVAAYKAEHNKYPEPPDTLFYSYSEISSNTVLDQFLKLVIARYLRRNNMNGLLAAFLGVNGGDVSVYEPNSNTMRLNPTVKSAYLRAVVADVPVAAASYSTTLNLSQLTLDIKSSAGQRDGFSVPNANVSVPLLTAVATVGALSNPQTSYTGTLDPPGINIMNQEGSLTIDVTYDVTRSVTVSSATLDGGSTASTSNVQFGTTHMFESGPVTWAASDVTYYANSPQSFTAAVSAYVCTPGGPLRIDASYSGTAGYMPGYGNYEPGVMSASLDVSPTTHNLEPLSLSLSVTNASVEGSGSSAKLRFQRRGRMVLDNASTLYFGADSPTLDGKGDTTPLKSYMPALSVPAPATPASDSVKSYRDYFPQPGVVPVASHRKRQNKVGAYIDWSTGYFSVGSFLPDTTPALVSPSAPSTQFQAELYGVSNAGVRGALYFDADPQTGGWKAYADDWNGQDPADEGPTRVFPPGFRNTTPFDSASLMLGLMKYFVPNPALVSGRVAADLMLIIPVSPSLFVTQAHEDTFLRQQRKANNTTGLLLLPKAASQTVWDDAVGDWVAPS